MKSIDEIDGLVSDFRHKSIGALSRCITLIENFPKDRHTIISKLATFIQTPLIIGFTGPPGVGKSSLINKLLYRFAEQYDRIAVLAFDPSSSISKGALLGDRIRMNEHLENDKIFIRSFASRGEYGGLSSAIYDVILVLSSFGFDLILIETVGIGQNEIEISSVSDVTVLVLDPLSGDSIQALKAGIMEIADIYSVNKNDIISTYAFEKNIQEILWDKHRNPRIVTSNSQSLEGIDQLYKNIKEIIDEYQQNKVIENKRKFRFDSHVKSIIESEFMEYYTTLYKSHISQSDFTKNNPYEITKPFLEKYLNTKK
jgi:LAO/AO transport system kinase